VTFITIKNKPKDNKVIGKVIRTRNGFNVTFKIARIMAIINAVLSESTYTPFSR
jgi:hypothetical protein